MTNRRSGVSKRLKRLHDENGKLKKLLADARNAALKDLLSKNGDPVVKRDPVAHFRTPHEMSERSSRRVGSELDLLIAERGKPQASVSDKGTELTSNAILAWTDESKVGRDYIAPAMQSAFVESLNRPLRDDFLTI